MFGEKISGVKKMSPIFVTLFFFSGLACTTVETAPQATSQMDVLQKYQEKEKVIQRAGANERPYDLESRPSFYAQLRSSSKNHEKLAGLLAYGQWQAASEEAKLILKARPGDPWALKMLATSFALGRKFDHASYYAYQLLLKEPNDADMLNILGLNSYFSDDRGLSSFSKARENFERAFQADPNHSASALNLGELYLAVGKFSNAKEIYAKILDRKPQIAVARMGYAMAALRLGAEDEAIIALKMILKQDPQNAKAMYHLALIYNDNLQDKKESETYLEKILAMDVQNHGVSELKRRANFLLRTIRGQDESFDIIADKTKSSNQIDTSDGNNLHDQNQLELLLIDDEDPSIQ